MNNKYQNILSTVFGPLKKHGDDLVWEKKFPDNDSIYIQISLSPDDSIFIKCRGTVAPIGSSYLRYSDNFIDELCLSLMYISGEFRDYPETIDRFMRLGLIQISRSDQLEHILEVSRNSQLSPDTFQKFILNLIREIDRLSIEALV